ncbi:glutamate racemase [Allofustis seminis]|uniref:glutamate racemase n=1 Tax=Allofustis seminis TaxID=166939 RepID=UPI00037AC843|nr:glutamate racemase [Allofustis seminis]
MKNLPIGMIDSGVGGLTVLKEAMHHLPNESFYYVADTAHCPYGSKSTHDIKQYVWQMIQFLLNKKIKLLVLACNTASAIFLKDLEKELSIPVIGVIQPGSQKAVTVTQNERIAVIATEATIQNGEYERSIKQLNADIQFKGLSCPTFVQLVESERYLLPSAQAEVDEVLSPLKDFEMDTLVLGCTHYPLLRPQIEQSIAKDVQIVDAGVESVEIIIQTLLHNKISRDITSTHPEVKFFTTGEKHGFEAIGKRWLNRKQMQVEQIEPGQLEGFVWKKK